MIDTNKLISELEDKSGYYRDEERTVLLSEAIDLIRKHSEPVSGGVDFKDFHIKICDLVLNYKRGENLYETAVAIMDLFRPYLKQPAPADETPLRELPEKLQNMIGAHLDGVYKFSARDNCDDLLTELFTALAEAGVLNVRKD